MNETKKELGKRIAEIRKSKKLNQKEFKVLIGAPTVQMISGWENGHSFPSVNYLIIIAKKLDTSLDYLLLGEQKGQTDKTIRTYKDAAICITNLLENGLFELGGYPYGQHVDQYAVTLTSKDRHIGSFKQELDNLLIAAKTLKPELLNLALNDLFEKYDYQIKKNK